MPSDPVLRRPVADRRLLRQNVFERLLADIIDGTLEPGRRLRDDELTGLLGVSRTPLREAVARLEELGLVDTAPNRFTRVAPLESEAIFESIDLLVALAPLLAERLVGRLDEEALLEADYVSLRLARLSDDDAARALGLLLRFAERLLADLELIPAFTTSVMTRLLRYAAQRPAILRAAGGITPVREIADALIERDAVLTGHRVADHLSRLAVAIRADRQPD